MATTPSTKLVVFEGGPPEWDGHVTSILAIAGAAERWCHTSDKPILYLKTDETREVEVETEKRSGKKTEKKTAIVYRYLGYRDEAA